MAVSSWTDHNFIDLFRWNAARAFASYLDENTELYRDKSVLELGAAGALPSIVAAKNGASQVCLPQIHK